MMKLEKSKSKVLILLFCVGSFFTNHLLMYFQPFSPKPQEGIQKGQVGEIFTSANVFTSSLPFTHFSLPFPIPLPLPLPFPLSFPLSLSFSFLLSLLLLVFAVTLPLPFPLRTGSNGSCNVSRVT